MERTSSAIPPVPNATVSQCSMPLLLRIPRVGCRRSALWMSFSSSGRSMGIPSVILTPKAGKICESPLGSGQESAPLPDGDHVAGISDVGAGIAFDHEQIGTQARPDAATIGEPERFGGRRRRGGQRLYGS